jgi:hypothetical protein
VLKQARYRALMLSIAPSVGRITTRRPGSLWAMMVSGVLAHKAKNLLKPMLDTFPCSTIGQSRLKAPSFTSIGRFIFGRVSWRDLKERNAPMAVPHFWFCEGFRMPAP